MLPNDAGMKKKSAKAALHTLDSLHFLYPDDFRVHNSLALAYAYLGKCDDAMAQTEKARKLMPLSDDPFAMGIATEQNVVIVLVICKKYDLAMDKLEYLLNLPGEGTLTIGGLQADPLFDAMKELPRFKKIVEKEYKIVYD
jgi:tetratricopeptide (TPR) repeat protein